jgi:hypothetical protein
MNRIFQLSIVIGLLMLLVQPARTEVLMDYKFQKKSTWAIGGFETYDIIVRGAIVGFARVDYSKITMMDQPANRVVFNQTWTDAGIANTIEIDSKMLVDGLYVVMSTHTEKVGTDVWRYEGNYTGKKMTFNAYLPGDPDVHEYGMNKTKSYVDVDILPFALRNIPFADRTFITFSTVDLSHQNSYTPIASVNGSETVDTGQAQYDCWIVNVSLPTGGYTAWYSKTDKHYLVKLHYNDRDLVLHRHS